MNTRKKRMFSAGLVLLLLVLLIWAVFPSQSEQIRYVEAMADFEAITKAEGENDYPQYLEAHSSASRPERIVRIEGESYAEVDGEGFEIAESLYGLEGTAVITPEMGSITWQINVDEPGMYQVRM